MMKDCIIYKYQNKRIKDRVGYLYIESLLNNQNGTYIRTVNHGPYVNHELFSHNPFLHWVTSSTLHHSISVTTDRKEGFCVNP